MTSYGINRIGLLILRHKLITAVSVLGLLIYGYSWLVSPHVNSVPRQKVVIRGQFPFNKGLNLSLQASFYSRNPSCKQTAQVFLVVPAASGIDASIDLDVPVIRENGEGYLAEINIDHFQPGFCDWQFGGMAYQFSGGKLSRPGLLHALGPFPLENRSITFSCEYHTISKPNLLTVSCGLPRRLLNDIDKTNNTAELNFAWKED